MEWATSTIRTSKHPSSLALVGAKSNSASGSERVPDGTVTLMVGGLEALTEMTERLGDRTAFEVLKSYQSIVRAEVRRHGGFEVEFQGDEFLVAFSAANRGLRCATAIASSLSSWSAEHPSQPLAARIGIHVGEPIREGNRFFGKPVIVASRIAAHARGGEIVVSSLVADLLAGNPDLAFDDGREVELKGLAGAQRIHGIVCGSAGAAEPKREAPRTQIGSEIGNHFRLDGDFWTIAYEGRVIRVRDVKGVRYIAALLRRPGEDVHVADLASPLGEASAAVVAGEAEITRGLGNAGEVIDRQASAQYRHRLESLEDEIDEAKRWNDFGRVESLQAEKEFITRELAGAYGLGGRARKASDSSERARKAVTSRIRDSIQRIEEDHPELGRHLMTALRLGTFCRYEPEVAVCWAA